MNSMRFSKPSPAAGRFVGFYGQRNHELGASTLIHPVTARAAQTLDFEFGDPIEISSSGCNVTEIAPAAAVIGLQTFQLQRLLLRGKIESFTVFLQPAALHLLFGLPILDLTNRHYETTGVLGSAVYEFNQQLGNATNFHERVQLADQFIQGLSFRAPVFDTIEQAANEIIRTQGGCRVRQVLDNTGLGIRQFERLFQQRIGASPQLYARIVRFESALETKAFSPRTSWTAIAHQFGYYDQMHMIQLSGETSTGILAPGGKHFCAASRFRERAKLHPIGFVGPVVY